MASSCFLSEYALLPRPLRYCATDSLRSCGKRASSASLKRARCSSPASSRIGPSVDALLDFFAFFARFFLAALLLLLPLEEAVEEPGADVPVTDAELVRKYRPAALATVTVAASATAAKRLSCTHRATRFAVAFDAIVDWVQPCNTYGGASSESKSHVCIGHSGGATRRRLASV